MGLKFVHDKDIEYDHICFKLFKCKLNYCICNV